MLIIVPSGIHVAAIVLGVLSTGAILVIVYRMLVGPALSARADTQSPPPAQGTVWDIVIEEKARERVITIGQLDSEIQTRMHGIKDDHLTLRFRKDRDLEEYEITVNPGGPIFYTAPHSKRSELMKSAESFESRELIGHQAVFRLAAALKDNRPIQYIEFELTTKYFINAFGTERMKFLFTLKKVFPGVDVRSRDKRGVYLFGRKKTGDSEETPA
ncbi:MAG: hypothetical protein HY042_07320 [Spirochaetia bacterium]|nr:hypothetical protein [Spirochaetia bacterium]